MDSVIEVSEGDVVIDAGGCYGETALDFALKAGGTGQFFLLSLCQKIWQFSTEIWQLNPDVAQRVKLIEKPLWEHSGEKLYIEGSGPGY